ncbi:HGGxSTG domain-containing protein [Cellulomonas sp. HD19AZ1]|uniref:HGGxSTG domain-containing protein n=1 Tax=Cellulomonas sp. HD19AZ1 TaxID=2559593 RepID=UPI003515ED87
MWDDDPIPCDKCGTPHARCTAHTRRGAHCGQPRMAGQRVCRLHGGKSPQALAGAERRQGEERARRALGSFGAPAGVSRTPGRC